MSEAEVLAGLAGNREAELLAEIERLREALIAVSHRSKGKCWCDWGVDIKSHGHASACRKAKEVLGDA